MRIFFGLFAIFRSDTKNDAMFDPAFVAALLCIVLRRCCKAVVRAGGLARFNATNSVQRAEGHKAQITPQLRVAKEKSSPKRTAFFFVLYRQFRCHGGKVNKIKGDATFEAILCASKIDAVIILCTLFCIPPMS